MCPVSRCWRLEVGFSEAGRIALVVRASLGWARARSSWLSLHLEEMEANRRAKLSLDVLAPAERVRSSSIRATGSDAFFAKQDDEGASARAGVTLMQAFRTTTSSTSRKAAGERGEALGRQQQEQQQQQQQQPKLD
ncbi:uncharacterized protein B0T15DRAFT_61485 [Chaetomium strumarium]|uniref:Uncharacterized protein n=1 Tax=Chaetomium strumarium TaxID=1170767 RepID=A0AAJ0H3G3_9PEZI|nr:hypothetical protein B0T15DRAFT_61485 [Chaetomium strumarium]